MTILQHLASVIAPHSCLHCGREGAIICGDCQADIVVTKAATCYRCNRLSVRGRTCPSCRHATALTGVAVASHYDGTIKQLVGVLKYERVRAAAGPLAATITPLLSDVKVDVITSVPVATNHYRQRGYNQAELIGRALAHQLELPYRPLVRRVRNVQQVGHIRRERLRQVAGAFAAERQDLSGQRVLVVDDVMTTGATLSECARILRTMGARNVWGAVAAKH